MWVGQTRLRELVVVCVVMPVGLVALLGLV